jgi:hypothetical protein
VSNPISEPSKIVFKTHVVFPVADSSKQLCPEHAYVPQKLRKKSILLHRKQARSFVDIMASFRDIFDACYLILIVDSACDLPMVVQLGFTCQDGASQDHKTFCGNSVNFFFIAFDMYVVKANLQRPARAPISQQCRKCVQIFLADCHCHPEYEGEF